MINRQLKLARRPESRVSLDDFSYEESQPPPVEDGAVLARTLFLSVDPTNRVWMKDVPQYMPPVALGEVMRAGGLAEVVDSRLDGFAPGDLVFGMTGWQDYALLRPGGALGLAKVPTGLDVAPERFLGICGPNGVTAYAGMVEVAGVGEGDTAVVTAAAGSVGSAAGQIAKLRGARVVGVAGGSDKVRMLVERYGFDAAVDYRADDFAEQLRATTREGIDVLFENVGGAVMETAIARMNARGRIALSGMISIYEGRGSTRYDWASIMAKRLKVQGFNLIDCEKLWPKAVGQLVEWLRAGRIVADETIVDGLDRAPEALNLLFDGANHGKMLVRVA
ncbi:NADP-dependent oxidoreductase [Novosphingobium sp. Gsoil 351]|uniref:NADP-dependent oxidoreductase n=1 Tax=Novosphingobium sp. Gsoil 351 TaxID=2675225 RepID=UPI0012B46000|nr:NADP-dependent oxidoreductase [Novosphingobium sp. Gsoil 351]QGN55689.1 zinc-binding dehydrogenase [Novosphingobium sp. Gsoil 351]